MGKYRTTAIVVAGLALAVLLVWYRREQGCRRYSKTFTEIGRYRTELSCLLRLEDGYTCTCAKKRRHFPRVISARPRQKTVTMTRVGTAVHLLVRDPRVPELEQQLRCIEANLRRAGVEHLDVRPWNVCHDGASGTLALIDFEKARVGASARASGDLAPKLRSALRRGQWSPSTIHHAAGQLSRGIKYCSR